MNFFNRTVIALLVCAMCGGCGPEGQNTTEPPFVDGIGLEEDTFAAVDNTPRIGETSLPKDTQPEQGAFLAPCIVNLECNSGYCIETRAGKKCTKTCVDSCPASMRCTQNATSGDVNFICTDPWVPLCQPCLSSNECAGSATGAIHTCGSLIGGETNGKFCLPVCTTGADCPTDFSCVSVPNSGFICVPQSGVCICTPHSTALKSFTTCLGGAFSCAGKRMCTALGLTTCEPVVKQEECNLKDDDCDGKTDEDLCEDGNSCTADACNPSKTCKHEILNGLQCNDGNDCTQVDGCVNGTCVGGKPVECNDKNPCTNDSCKPITGCVYENNAKSCDDGNQCTDNDTCGGGTCSVTKLHPCNDGNICTIDSCKPDKGCVFAPNTDPGAGKGVCPSDGNQCTEDKCQGGGCKSVPIPGCG